MSGGCNPQLACDVTNAPSPRRTPPVRGTEYELELVNLIELAYTEYQKPEPTSLMLLVRNMMSNRGVDKFLRGYFDQKDFLDSHIINLAEMVALRRITEETEMDLLEAEWVTPEAEEAEEAD